LIKIANTEFPLLPTPKVMILEGQVFSQKKIPVINLILG